MVATVVATTQGTAVVGHMEDEDTGLAPTVALGTAGSHAPVGRQRRKSHVHHSSTSALGPSCSR